MAAMGLGYHRSKGVLLRNKQGHGILTVMYFHGRPVSYIVCVTKRAPFVPRSVSTAAFLSILENALLFPRER